MSLFLLFISFFFACTGAWIFFDGYFSATNSTEEFYAAAVGLAWAVIPYMVGKTLAEMVAIRQRHMQLEQTAQFNYMMAEQMQMAEKAMREAKAETARQARQAQAAATGGVAVPAEAEMVAAPMVEDEDEDEDDDEDERPS